MLHDLVISFLLFPAGWLLRHYWPVRELPPLPMLPSFLTPPPPKYPYSPLPVVSRGQAVTVIFTKDGIETAHRRVESQDLALTLSCPKGGPPQHEYTYSHLDPRGSFIYTFTRDL